MTGVDDKTRALGRIEGILESSGLSVEELVSHLATLEEEVSGRAVPDDGVTVSDLVDSAIAALDPGTVRTYRSYWRVLEHGIRLPGHWDEQQVRQWAADAEAANREKDLGLDIDITGASFVRVTDDDGTEWLQVVPGYASRHPAQIRESHLRVLAKWVRVRALASAAYEDRQRTARGVPPRRQHGKGAVENFVAAMRSLFRFGAGDGAVPRDHTPAQDIKKPKREPTVERRPLTDPELDDIWLTTATTGDDPELDKLLYRFHINTGGRQEAAIYLKLKYLLRDEVYRKRRYRNAIVLDQKGDKIAVVPVPGSLLDDLESFAASRGSTEPNDPVFRYRGRHRCTGAPASVTRR